MISTTKFTIIGIGSDMEPVEKHAQDPAQNFHRCICRGSAAPHQQPNAISSQSLALLQGNIIGCQRRAVLLGVGHRGIFAGFKVYGLGLSQQAHHRFDHVHLHLGIHLPGGLQAAVDHVVASSPGVVPVAVALAAVADRVVAIEAGALRGEADGEGRLLVGAAVLVLADHGYLLHRMQDVAELQAPVLPVNLVGALDAQIEGWRTIWGIGNADAVVIAHLGRLRISGVRAVLPLAGEGHQVIFNGNMLRTLLENTIYKNFVLIVQCIYDFFSYAELFCISNIPNWNPL